MKRLVIISAAALLAACGGDTPTKEASEPKSPVADVPAETEEIADTQEEQDIPTYDEEAWYISPGWPGEYPPGFSIMEDGVEVLARAGMHDSLPREITCALPKNATYQLWNRQRVDTDALEFVTVSEKFNVTINTAAEIDSPVGEFDSPENTLKLEPGDTITYLRYIGEGWTLMEFDGRERDINEMDLMDISDIQNAGESAAEDLLWVNVPCGEERGWITLSEALADPNILMSPITGYGDARDMTEEDRQIVLDQAKFAEEFENEN